MLQDFDAQPYGLERHLPSLARYVKAGGGLIMVGGPNSFVAGDYANTPLAEVLPVTLDGSPGATAADVASVVPSWTDDGRAAPLLAPLRDLIGEELPQMPGANVLGDVRPGGLVLWAHPTRTTRSGAPMPILAIGEQGDGRSIALGLDGGMAARFSQLGARTSGRGYGAFWDGLLGWLMRDPRFEPGQLELVSPCVADTPTEAARASPFRERPAQRRRRRRHEDEGHDRRGQRASTSRTSRRSASRCRSSAPARRAPSRSRSRRSRPAATPRG